MVGMYTQCNLASLRIAVDGGRELSSSARRSPRSLSSPLVLEETQSLRSLLSSSSSRQRSSRSPRTLSSPQSSQKLLLRNVSLPSGFEVVRNEERDVESLFEVELRERRGKSRGEDWGVSERERKKDRESMGRRRRDEEGGVETNPRITMRLVVRREVLIGELHGSSNTLGLSDIEGARAEGQLREQREGEATRLEERRERTTENPSSLTSPVNSRCTPPRIDPCSAWMAIERVILCLQTREEERGERRKRVSNA